MEENRKTKRDKKAYLNSFQLNDKGEYVYQGKLYVAKDYSLKKYLTDFVLPWTVAFILSLICGMIPADGMKNCFYVILPWLWCLLSCVLTGNHIISLCFSYREIRGYRLEKAVAGMPSVTGSGVVSSCFTVLSMFLYLILNRDLSHILTDLFFVLAHICIGGLLFFIKTRFSRMDWMIVIDR